MGHDEMQGVRDNVERISTDMRERASQMATDFSERASEYYDEATDWLSKNYGKALMAVGVFAAVGIAGYYIATRNQRSTESENLSEAS